MSLQDGVFSHLDALWTIRVSLSVGVNLTTYCGGTRLVPGIGHQPAARLTINFRTEEAGSEAALRNSSKKLKKPKAAKHAKGKKKRMQDTNEGAVPIPKERGASSSAHGAIVGDQGQAESEGRREPPKEAKKEPQLLRLKVCRHEACGDEAACGQTWQKL
jgi:hypothetical protein